MHACTHVVRARYPAAAEAGLLHALCSWLVPIKYACSTFLAQAVKRWFEDTYAEATRGDVKQQALLGQMYAEGYGCEKDQKAAQEWTDRAAARGYRMKGVYCEL